MEPNKFTKVAPTSCHVISISSAKVQCIVFATWIALLWSPINGSASMRASVRSGPCHYPHSTRSPTPRAGQGMPGLFTILYLSMGGSRGGKTAVHQSDRWIKKKPQQTKPYFPDRVRKEKTLMKSYTFCTCASVSSSAPKQWMTARYPQLPPPETALNKNCTSQNNVHNTPISIDLVCNLPKHDAVQYEILIEHPVCNKVKDAAIRWQPLKMCACFW